MHPCSRHKKTLKLKDFSTSSLQSISMWMMKVQIPLRRQYSLCLNHCIERKLHCTTCKYSSGNLNNKNPSSLSSFRWNPRKSWSHSHKLEGFLHYCCMSHNLKHLHCRWSILCCKWFFYKVKLKNPPNILLNKNKLEGHLFGHQHILCSL